MTPALTRVFHAFAIWLSVVTLAPSTLAAPHNEVRAPEARAHGPEHGPEHGKPTARLGVGRDGRVETSRALELRGGERSIHRIATERRAEPPAAKVEVRRVAETASEKKKTETRAPTAPPRDWTRAPAIVEHEARGEVFAVSDLHGRYEESFHLLEGNKVLKGDLSRPGEVEWTGGTATVVVVGDVINKGGGSLKVIDMLRALQKSAESKGGKVIVTMGNHEASFLHEPLSERSLREAPKAGLGSEIRRAGGDPELVAAGGDPEGRGAWLRELPFAAKVGDYFFLHSGNTRGEDRSALTATIQRAMADEGYGHEHLIGEDAKSVLGADDWTVTAAQAKTNAEKLGVKHIVMGHIPKALDAHGDIARSEDGALIKLDTGLGNGDGEARMLRIGKKGGTKQLDTKGARSKLKRQRS